MQLTLRQSSKLAGPLVFIRIMASMLTRNNPFFNIRDSSRKNNFHFPFIWDTASLRTELGIRCKVGAKMHFLAHIRDHAHYSPFPNTENFLRCTAPFTTGFLLAAYCNSAKRPTLFR